MKKNNNLFHQLQLQLQLQGISLRLEAPDYMSNLVYGSPRVEQRKKLNLNNHTKKNHLIEHGGPQVKNRDIICKNLIMYPPKFSSL